MSEFLDQLKGMDEDARYAYVEAFTNALVSEQIKRFREKSGLNQQQLAEIIGTKQSGISRLEQPDYTAWKVETLRKLARAFGVRLRIGFADFGTLEDDFYTFGKDLEPSRFGDDHAVDEKENTGSGDLLTIADGHEKEEVVVINSTGGAIPKPPVFDHGNFQLSEGTRANGR